MGKRKQFCPQGHDTFVMGRKRNRRCRECTRVSDRTRVAAHRTTTNGILQRQREYYKARNAARLERLEMLREEEARLRRELGIA